MADAKHIDHRRAAAIDQASLGVADSAQVRLETLGFESLVNLRGDAEDGRFVAAVHEVAGISPPREPNAAVHAGSRCAFWLGPDEWLLAAPDGEAGTIESRLRKLLGDDPWLSVVDLSHNYTGFGLCGDAARDVLAKGCPLDLHPSVFTVDRCAQSVVAHARVLLAVAPDGEGIDIRVRNSFAAYLAAWLTDAMLEFGD